MQFNNFLLSFLTLSSSFSRLQQSPSNINMSQIFEASPKHCAKKGFKLKFFNKLFKILSTLTLSILSLILLLWFILHPAKPQFILQEVNVYQLNFPSPRSLNSSIEITLEVRNPNQKVGIYYDDLRTYASYKGQPITTVTLISSSFYQGQQDSNLLSSTLIGNGLPVAPSLGYEVGRDKTAGKLVLIIKVDGRLRWKVATWVSGLFRINVNCVASLTLTSMNLTAPLTSKLGTQCSTTI